MAPVFNSPMSRILLCVVIVLVWSTMAHGNPADVDIGSKRCLDFDLDRIDAMCTLKNQSLLLIRGSYFWTLTFEPENQTVSLPKQSNRKPLTALIATSYVDTLIFPHFVFPVWGPNNQTNRSDITMQILAIADIPVVTVNNTCVDVDQRIYIIGKFHDGTLFYYREGPDHAKSGSTDAKSFDFFVAAKSVNFSEDVSAMTFYKGTVIIFQGNYSISFKCSNGQWKEIMHREIDLEFPRGEFMGREPDSAFVPPKSPEQEDDVLIMFYGRQYVSCQITGNDPCEGPYDTVEEFFNVDETCPLMYPVQGFSIWSTVALATVAVLIVALLLLLSFDYLLRAERLQILTYYDIRRKDPNTSSACAAIRSGQRQLPVPRGGTVHYEPVAQQINVSRYDY